jgi:hypothetical protein
MTNKIYVLDYLKIIGDYHCAVEADMKASEKEP